MSGQAWCLEGVPGWQMRASAHAWRACALFHLPCAARVKPDGALADALAGCRNGGGVRWGGGGGGGAMSQARAGDAPSVHGVPTLQGGLFARWRHKSCPCQIQLRSVGRCGCGRARCHMARSHACRLLSLPGAAEVSGAAVQRVAEGHTPPEGARLHLRRVWGGWDPVVMAGWHIARKATCMADRHARHMH